MTERFDPLAEPEHWSSEYVQWFQDQAIVHVYHHFSPYPARVFDLLDCLIVDLAHRVLDVVFTREP